MARVNILPVALAFCCFAASSPVPPNVESIQFASYPDHTLVYLVSDRAIRFRTGKLIHPERFYLDIPGVTVAKDLRFRVIEVKDSFLTSIRIAMQDGASARVVFDLNPSVLERVVPLTNPPGLLVNFEKRTEEAGVSVTEFVPKTH